LSLKPLKAPVPQNMWLQPQDFLNLHHRYLEAVGRSLLLAQSFEQNCKYVLLIWDLGRAFKDGKLSDVDELPDYSSVLLKRFLGEMISRFDKAYGLKPEQFDVLKKARDARNYIAHEAATPCLFSHESDKAIAQGLPQFRENVEALAVGDNLVAGWSYMIQENELPPSHIAQRYRRQMTSWVLEPLRENGYDC
jgi:hypothetical protein